MMRGTLSKPPSTALVAVLLGASVAGAAGQENPGAAAMPAGMPGPGTCALGERVLAIRAALEDPDSPGALRAVVELGSDSRYYVMVRGWLAMQLQADIGIVEASGANVPASVASRVEFLQQAIRAIDLE